MDKWNKLYQFIKNLEDDYFDIAFDFMGKDDNKYIYYQSLGSLCTKIRYTMEEMEED